VAAPAAAPAGTGPEAGFRRLHPFTPVLRGWKIFAAAFAIGLQQAYGDISFGWLLTAVALSIPVGVVYGWASWRTTKYRVGDEDLRLETGVFR
jgi:putative membrane protein